MNSEIALESLIQRGRTPLFNDLVSLYQNTQDALRDNPKASGKDIKIVLKLSKFSETLKSVIKKHMNIDIHKVLIVNSSGPNAFVTSAISKEGLKIQKSKKSTLVLEVSKLEDLYDDKTGKISNHNEDSVLRFFFGITTGLLETKDEEGNPFYTTEELTAVTLHELGHYDHFIRSRSQVVSKIIDAADIVDYIQETPKKETLLKIIDLIRKSNTLDSSWTKILNHVEKQISTDYDLNKKISIETVNTLSVVFSNSIATITLNMYKKFFEELPKSIFLGSSNLGVKDIRLDSERSSDEFAVRNGGMNPLMSFLTKTERLYQGDLSNLFLTQSANSQTFMIYTLQTFRSRLRYYAEDLNKRYDPLMRRLELLIETSKHAFSDPKLPDEIKSDMILQIKESEKYLKEYRSMERSRERDTVSRWVESINKFDRFIKAPFSYRLLSDYDRLQESTRHLSRNPLHYIAKS